MLSIVLIALSLAVDATAVSVSVGIANPGGGPRQALRLGLWFGGFQLIMPLAGYVLGRGLSGLVSAAAPWVAFALLSFVGVKMMADGAFPCQEEVGCPSNRQLCLLAVATSLDALAVGVSAAFLDLPVVLSAGVIGLVAFVLSAAGALAGKLLGRAFHRWSQLLGGAVLMLIGLRFLLERLGPV